MGGIKPPQASVFPTGGKNGILEEEEEVEEDSGREEGGRRR